MKDGGSIAYVEVVHFLCRVSVSESSSNNAASRGSGNEVEALSNGSSKLLFQLF